jgi:glycerol-3-phosphate dehydrogenase
MASRRSTRILKPILYSAAAAGLGTATLYTVYRPRNIPGSEAAAVPPPIAGEGGHFRLPDFPAVKTRDEQIADLKRSCAANSKAGNNGYVAGIQESITSLVSGAWGGTEKQPAAASDEDEPYDLLIIGAGATGAGIALDAATRGLKVAVVERDDFSSGTSSKSTKLVHGGVRYLEKAVWELDYSQYVCTFHNGQFFIPILIAFNLKIQIGQRSTS